MRALNSALSAYEWMNKLERSRPAALQHSAFSVAIRKQVSLNRDPNFNAPKSFREVLSRRTVRR
jgi:hypothetical protein